MEKGNESRNGTMASYFSKLGGFTAMPSLLLKSQRELKLNNNELSIISHILNMTFGNSKTPTITKRELADRMSCSTNTIDRIKAGLINKNLLNSTIRTAHSGVYVGSDWDLGPLFLRLEKLSIPTTPLKMRYHPTDDAVPPRPWGGATPPVGCPIRSIDLSSRSKDLDQNTYTDKKENEMEQGDRLARARELAKVKSEESAKAEEKKSQKRASRFQKQASFQVSIPDEKEKPPHVQLSALWFEKFRKKFPDIEPAGWTKTQFVQMANLLKIYKFDQIETMLSFIFDNWGFIQKKWFKGNATFPTLGMLVKLHEGLWLEGQAVQSASKTIKEKDEWMLANPDSFAIPQDLQERVFLATEVMKKYE